MSPTDIRRAALWLRRQAEAQGRKEADAIRERLLLRQRIADQPRDPQGRWTPCPRSDAAP